MIIKLEDVTINSASFRGVKAMGKPILSNVNLEVYQGELVYLIGKVGSGKSTLLKTLYGELPLSYGKGHVAGFNINNLKRTDIPFLRRRLGIVFQDFQLLPDRNIYENMRYVMLATYTRNERTIRNRIYEVLSLVNLESKVHKMPFELSGGEQQRAAIGRAFLNRPELIIADEPTGNLDPETSEEILSLFSEITQMGCSVLLATHDVSLIEHYPSRTLRFNNGTIEEIDIYDILGIKRPQEVDDEEINLNSF